jgi:hypothetical protein
MVRQGSVTLPGCGFFAASIKPIKPNFSQSLLLEHNHLFFPGFEIF